jgi:transcriptional regulator with XRE-family HTH domain
MAMTRPTSTTAKLAWVRKMLADGTARQYRERANLSRSDLACELSVDESTYARWENAKRVPRRDIALRLGDLLAKLKATLDADVGKGPAAP